MTLQPGTVSSGTLRTRDLLEAFVGVLTPEMRTQINESGFGWGEDLRIVDDFPAYVADRPEGEGDQYWDSEAAADFVEYLTDLLNEHAPEGHHFGTIEGDGADFGFWPNEDEDVDP